MAKQERRQAVVLGGSMAGLLAARVLADHFERVTLVERDLLADEPGHRKGVPQARHGHGLLAAGKHILEGLFPGIVAALLADGATPVNMGQDLRWYHFGGEKRRFASDVEAVMPSRPLLDAHVRRRLRALPNVTVLDGHDVVSLLASPTGDRVVGVKIRGRAPGAAGAAERALEADCVVDALGRGSPIPRWVAALGYPAPPEEEVRVDVTYTSRVYRVPAGEALDFRMLLVSPEPPERRLGGIFPLEGGRCMVTLVGWLGERAPTDAAGFLEFARSLPSPLLADTLARLEPVEDAVSMGFPSNRWRHYERLGRFPAGLLPIGDAICSFNPAFGQGMTVACLEAMALGRAVAAGMPPRRYFKELAAIVGVPWSITVGEDFRFAEVEGARPPGTAFLHWYIGRVHRMSQHDPRVFGAFLKVMNMLAPPPSLLAPRVAVRVLRPLPRRSAPAAPALAPPPA